MTFLPIVSRELRVAARKTSTYWFRTWAAALVLLLCLWIMGMTRYQSAAETAEVLFAITTASAGLFAALGGVRFTADCLSREKRDGTLGFLFLTDLRAYDIVLGKLAAASVDALYGILAVVPIMALPLLLGGVSLGEFIRMALVVVNTLLFSLAAGVMVSSMTRSAQAGSSGTILILLFFMGMLPALGVWAQSHQPGFRIEPFFLVSSPGYAYFQAFDSSYSRGPGWFWLSLATINALGWLFLLIASWVIPRAWQDRPNGTPAGGARSLTWRAFMYGPTPQAVRYRKALLAASPYFWLAARARRQKHLFWTTLAVMAVGWLLAWAKWKSDWLDPVTFFVSAGVLNLTLRAWLASEGSRQLAQDRHSGAIELLLSTPLEPGEIVRGQMLALRRMFLGPLVAVLLVEILFLAATVKGAVFNDKSEMISVWVGMMVMLVADMAALPWVSMWFGLTARQPNQAAGTSLGWILIFPWGLLAGVMLLSVLGPGSHMGFGFFLGAWLTLGLGTDIVMAGWARLKLETEFRKAAAQRFTPKPTLLERLAKL